VFPPPMLSLGMHPQADAEVALGNAYNRWLIEKILRTEPAGASAPLNLAKHHAVDMNVPIACGGVAVYPGDIVVADVDGVVIVPREMAEEVARDATEQEQLEIFISQRIEEGRPLRGTYPPNEETLAAYAQWRAQKQ